MSETASALNYERPFAFGRESVLSGDMMRRKRRRFCSGNPALLNGMPARRQIGLHRLWRIISIRHVFAELVRVGVGAVQRTGRRYGAEGPIVRTVLAILLLFFTAAATSAQEPATTPALIAVFGDSQAQGLAVGLQRVLVEDPRYRVLNRTHPGAALVHNESEWLGPVQRFVERDKADIAVVMFGANDRLDMRDGHSYLRFRSDEWRAAYADRIDQILTLLTGTGMKILWCGNPIARSSTYSDGMSYINEIYAGEVARFGAQFVPLWSVVTDDQGQFTAYGKDRGGTTQRLRTDDGIHFTAAGYELIADKIVNLLSTAAANAP